MTIKVVGIGLEGKKSLNDQVLEIVCSANILVGGDRHLSYFPEHKGERIKIGDLNQVIFEIKEKKEGINIVILASGDPLFFGIGRILLANFAQEELEFYPNLSCVQLAFNKLKTSWQDCKVISLHGRDIELLIKELKKGSEKIALLTDNNNNPLVIWRLYQQIKIGEDYDIWLCENLGDKSQEKLTKINSEKDINLDNISPLNIVIFLNQKIEDNAINIHQLPIIGIPDNYFKTFPDRPSLITKNEIRLLILGKLALQEKQVIWDVGAGTGSVSIEMARIAKNSQIYAIEKKAIAISLIRENCQKFMVNNINIIHNSAEKVMATLPSPDRVFIGGSSGNLKLLLNIIKDKINPEGKIVIALATIENLGIAVEWFKENKWDYEIINSQINKSLSIGKMTRFNPLNPVNIITAIKN